MLLQMLQLRVVLPDGLHLVLRAMAPPPPPSPPVITHEGCSWRTIDQLLTIAMSPVEGFGLLAEQLCFSQWYESDDKFPKLHSSAKLELGKLSGCNYVCLVHCLACARAVQALHRCTVVVPIFMLLNIDKSHTVLCGFASLHAGPHCGSTCIHR